MATTTKPETPATATTAPEAVLVARYKREMTRSAVRTYRRVVREFAKDAACNEEAAKVWLANAGIAEPPKNGAK